MFLLDIRYNPENSTITKWIKDGKECRAVREVFHPVIYITLKAGLLPLIASLPYVKKAWICEKSTWLGRQPEKIIAASVEAGSVYEMANMLEAKGCCLYNIDVDPIRQYLLKTGLFPAAKLNGNSPDDNQFAIDYELPELTCMDISISPRRDKGIMTFNDPIRRITIGDNVIKGMDEAKLIETLIYELERFDPDIIITDNGDAVDIPYLYHRVSLYELDVQLGREKEDASPGGRGRSYFSYGRIFYKPKKHLLSGRLHLDRSSFMFREGGLSGLIDLSRITGIPLQELSRLSPGSAVTALQVNEALRDGVLVPWKRNLAEYWKTAEELLIADRGALVIEPKVGLHENVYEVDFTSLFPNIMIKHNISPETVLCSCCPDSEKRVPFVNYNICQKRIGLIPRVLEPLVERRMEFKRRASMDTALAGEYNKKQLILKWLLVTSFGYMGFNKARFGRIECYESITAYGRELLLKTMEIADRLGCEVLHGIVDSLWVKGGDHEHLCGIASREIGIPLELKGHFMWIVFLPNRSNGAGALNRYYGVSYDGKIKVRGIEIRRNDTPQIVRNLQESMLACLAEAKTACDFYLKIPEAIEILRDYTDRVQQGEAALSDMVFETRVSRKCDDYRQFNNQQAALKQLRNEGVEVVPGQTVRYIITDHSSRNYMKRVIIPEVADSDAQYDMVKYYEFLLRAAESLLLPFGYSRQRLDDMMKNRVQRGLWGY